MRASVKRHSGSDRSLLDLSFDTLFALIARRMAYSQCLDLESVLAQLEEEFVSTEGEYEAFEDQGTLATASDSDGGAKRQPSVQFRQWNRLMRRFLPAKEKRTTSSL